MVFQKIKGWFDNHDEEIKELISCPVLTGRAAEEFINSLEKGEKPKEPVRGIYQEKSRWVVFEYDGADWLVEDFIHETLGYAWLFHIDWGYFRQPQVGWIAFYTPSTIPEHRVFKVRRDAREYVEQKKEE